VIARDIEQHYGFGSALPPEESHIIPSLGNNGLKTMVTFLCLVRFYQAYCTLVMRYCHITGGSQIRFQTRRSTGGCKTLHTLPLLHCHLVSHSPVTVRGLYFPDIEWKCCSVV